jgi:uncharacterized membrane protein YeiH
MNNIMYFLDLIGTFAFALSGAIAGIRKNTDIYGMVVLGCVTAVGGGTLRDILVGRIPPFIFHDYNYLTISILASILVFFFHNIFEKQSDILLIMDALGLGVFTIIGLSVGLDYNIGYFGAIMMGVMTGTAGGMIRDVLLGEIPLVLQKTVYASACLAGGILFVILLKLGLGKNINIAVSALFVFIIRIFAIKLNWHLPKVK